MSWSPSDEQQAIINHDPNRHARVLAGPGTGKSATIIRMLQEVSRNRGVRGKLLTFTRAATNELREKVTEQWEDFEVPSTIHSFAISTLLANRGSAPLPEPIRIADGWEWKSLIRLHLKDLMGCDAKTIDRARTEMASNWESLEPIEDPDLPELVRHQFIGTWQQHRTVFGYCLLAELPYRLLTASRDNDDLNIGSWKILVVDEYQDLNSCDLEVIKELSERDRSILAAGDDDQSIYSFRRAHPVGIREFAQVDYPGASNYSLSISQRCAVSILTWARSVIEGMPGRPPRPALVAASHCQPGEAHYLRFRNWDDEVEGVARIVRWLVHLRGIPPEEIAVLFRSDHNQAWSTPLAQALDEAGVPVVRRGEIEEMLNHATNRRFLAMARLVYNLEDSLAWWTVLHLTHGIGSAIRDGLYERAVAAQRTFSAQLLHESEEEFAQCHPHGRKLLQGVTESVLNAIAEIDTTSSKNAEVGWGSWLVNSSDQLGACDDSLRGLLTDLDEIIPTEDGLGRYLGQIEPVGNDLRTGRSAGAVRLMTMASSKGLTVRATLVVGVEDGLIPHANADPEEERRLLYVAMTRSTEYLYMTWSGRRHGQTARSGAVNVGGRRKRSKFVESGPVESQSGAAYLESISV